MMDDWRHLGLEIMVTLSETAPAMMRKNARNYIVALIHEVLKMLTQLSDEENWSVSDEIIEDDSDRLFTLMLYFDYFLHYIIVIFSDFFQSKHNCRKCLRSTCLWSWWKNSVTCDSRKYTKYVSQSGLEISPCRSNGDICSW